MSNRASPFWRPWGEKLPQRAAARDQTAWVGAAERDVYPTRYSRNTPERLAAAAAGAGFSPVAVVHVGTLHRYARGATGEVDAAGGGAALPERRRSTIVASYR